VLAAYPERFGIPVDLCIFWENIADIGLRMIGILDENCMFIVTNWVFSGEYPSADCARWTGCRTHSVTASWAITTQLRPTYSLSANSATRSLMFVASSRLIRSQMMLWSDSGTPSNKTQLSMALVSLLFQ
jgi:hypothetical protein